MGVFTPEEYRVFAEAEAFLWTTRVHLHLLNGRASEQLTFDTQVEIAAPARLPRRPTASARSSGSCRTTSPTPSTSATSRASSSPRLEARHVKPRPSLGEKLRTVFAFGKDPARPGYRLKHGRLDFVDEDAFAKDPVNILRLFEEALATDIPIHPDALRRVAANLAPDRRRASAPTPEANRIFLDLLLSHNNPERALRLMNEVGVLGAFIPEFGRIVAMMQFNMYHYYTVDEHIIRTISTLSQIERARARGRAAGRHRHPRQGRRPAASLYVALLLHDIGKGSGRDHSEYGAEVAERLCPRLGLDAEETELVVWLVQEPPADVRHRAEARPRRAAHGARLRPGGEEPDAAEAPDRADRLRHPRRRARASGTTGRPCCCAGSTARRSST